MAALSAAVIARKPGEGRSVICASSRYLQAHRGTNLPADGGRCANIQLQMHGF